MIKPIKITFDDIKNIIIDILLNENHCVWLVGWLCLTSHRQRGHLETAPPFTVPCEGIYNIYRRLEIYTFLNIYYIRSDEGDSPLMDYIKVIGHVPYCNNMDFIAFVC